MPRGAAVRGRRYTAPTLRSVSSTGRRSTSRSNPHQPAASASPAPAGPPAAGAAAVGAHYRALERAGRPLPAPPPLRLALEDSLARLRTLPPGAARDEALLGLIGLRQGLFAGHPLQRSLRVDPASPAGLAPEGDGVSAA